MSPENDPLLQPFQLKHLRLKNRMMITSHEPAYPEDGMPKAKYRAYHVERAKAGPFGAPIAHGFLTLSLIPQFFDSALTVTEARMGVNYGLNKVRFIAPVPVNSRLRAQMKLLASDPIDNGGRQQLWEVTVEREGAPKPVCVAESLARQYP